MCSTQWRVIPTFSRVVYQGLDYASLNAVFSMMKIRNKKEILNKIKLLEIGALEGLNG